jgi:hypothetical protein
MLAIIAAATPLVCNRWSAMVARRRPVERFHHCG